MDVPKKSVAGIAIEKGKLFIARRKPGGALGEKWEFPGGKVEPGETGEAALIREYQEELGVPVTIGPLLGEASFEYRGLHRLCAYRVYLPGYDFTLAEHTEWRWAGLAEIEQLDFADSDRKLLPYLKPYLH
ncbi:MAG: (deoxy)nucleoside triphosphate pyrophosphohydrolase [Treponema sp.]|jgi:8-oxo-dGTP diphosphatase|nr:(deoxy)nucleoside triphosphate pyrophosphohydrolase [Treponema sp.]